MTDTKFTPGPWNYFEPVVRAKGCAIAEVIPQPKGIADANARLIAAAPEMYKALKAVQLQLLQSNNNTEYAQEALDMARAALAKAVQP